jgi:dCTP deaminase
MYLCDKDIEKAVKNGDIVLKGFQKKRLQPASYDILLGNKFQILDQHQTDFIDPSKKRPIKVREINLKDGEKFILHPGVSVLGISKDYFGSSKFLVQLSGKSSLARIGLIVHNTAGLINPGHFLNITFELCNLNSVPIILRPGMEIAQLIFSELSSSPMTDFHAKSKYDKDNWKMNHKKTTKKKLSAKKKK